MKAPYSFAKYHPGVSPTHPGFKTRPPHDVFPEDIECVLEGQQNLGSIFIGNLQAAENPQTLKKLRIQSILTACKNIHIKHPKEHVPFSLYIPGEDHENYDLSVHFETAINFIHQSLKETNILVHCMAGVSRSVTLVLAYMIKHLGMSYNQAHKHVQRKRSKINPNPGFIRQLQRFEQNHTLQRSRYRHSSDHSETTIKSKYDSVYKPKAFSYKDVENVENYSGKYQPADYSRYSLQRSQMRAYNPQYEQQNFYKTNTSFNSTMKTPYQAIPRNNSNNRLKEVLNTMNSTTTNATSLKSTKKNDYTSVPRDRSIQNLSRDLDDRIAKIKQKYYQTSNSSYENKKINLTDYDRKWETSQIEERKVSNYVGETLARSRASRESLRNSIYTPYNATRSITYQYA